MKSLGLNLFIKWVSQI